MQNACEQEEELAHGSGSWFLSRTGVLIKQTTCLFLVGVSFLVFKNMGYKSF